MMRISVLLDTALRPTPCFTAAEQLSDGNDSWLLTQADRLHIAFSSPMVLSPFHSMYYDEDGDLAHEFYEETIVTKNGRKRAKLKRIHKNLIPQGIVKLEHPRIHVDFPVIICEV
ncbi:tumor suppressor candidate 2 isoform X1 [Chelonia mydas]|uniref:Tumor suppressor candidate 2 n=1 Tax=Chelonia mydas TaxID=8469 RepID=M7BPF3_CHEMY|nr:tumor suppressor candidate 2 isoform X1 [Chelonia mydas]EMP33868.1 Tumor suppressor candidate 2 [Chelonia mydas]